MTQLPSSNSTRATAVENEMTEPPHRKDDDPTFSVRVKKEVPLPYLIGGLIFLAASWITMYLNVRDLNASAESQTKAIEKLTTQVATQNTSTSELLFKLQTVEFFQKDFEKRLNKLESTK